MKLNQADEGMVPGLRVQWTDQEKRHNSASSFASSCSSMWQDLAAGFWGSSTSQGPEYPRQACSRSLTRAWVFCHRIQFPCGMFVSTFHSFKKSDNIGRERHSGPRTRIEFPIKTATLQKPLFPTVPPCKPYPDDWWVVLRMRLKTVRSLNQGSLYTKD